jgi:hypothetical protein
MVIDLRIIVKGKKENGGLEKHFDSSPLTGGWLSRNKFNFYGEKLNTDVYMVFHDFRAELH